MLKNFAWEDQRAKVYFIFHKVQLRCEECFIEQEWCFMKLQSLIKYSYACYETSGVTLLSTTPCMLGVNMLGIY